MKDDLKTLLVIIVGILAAGALLNLAAKFPFTKPGADFVTKGYGAL